MTPPSRQTRHDQKRAIIGSLSLLLGGLLIGVTPLTATAIPIMKVQRLPRQGYMAMVLRKT